MVKRLTRAKQKIARAGIPYRVPEVHELPERLPPVVVTVYFLFNEGYSATAGDDPVRHELADEAVRLARVLRGLLPDEPSVLGLLALLLLQHSRRDTRRDTEGRPVIFADQDRRRWRRDEITEGVTLVGEGLRRCPDRPDAFVVQAAIAACHAMAPTAQDTPWEAIVSWYDVLLSVRDGPVERLNRAVALGERDGPAAGLAAVAAIDGLAAYAPGTPRARSCSRGWAVAEKPTRRSPSPWLTNTMTLVAPSSPAAPSSRRGDPAPDARLPPVTR